MKQHGNAPMTRQCCKDCRLVPHENTGGGRLKLVCVACDAVLYIYYWRMPRVYLWRHELPPNVNLATYAREVAYGPGAVAEFARAA